MVVWRRKEAGYIDLSDKMRKQQEKISNFRSEVPEVKKNVSEENSSNGGGFFGFFGGGNSSTSSTSTPNYSQTESGDANERKRKLAKRLMDMTSKMEEMENQIYQLKQKIEVLENKQRLGY
jgi:hypothetical protein